MKPWNTDTSISIDNVREVKFYFETSKGPGSVTTLVNKGVSIESAKANLLKTFEGCYQSIEIVKYEMIRIISNDD